MTDRELLELAAKAAGIDYYARAQSGGMLTDNGEWNPLTDDGDALRLMVRLKMTPMLRDMGADVVDMRTGGLAYEKYGNDPYAATRRAIVRAAAEIGRNKT
jgi:hypothetical protein